ncbi:MAG: hypothetical protein ACO1N5_09025 [Noviherbaspirillum sp.]
MSVPGGWIIVHAAKDIDSGEERAYSIRRRAFFGIEPFFRERMAKHALRTAASRMLT